VKILIVGVGKMGTWFARELSKSHEVAIYDRLYKRMEGLPGVNRFKNIDDVKSFNPDLFINAVNIENTISAFNQFLPYLSEKCILSDITSVKMGISEYYKRIGRDFVSTHPMFGPTFSDINNLKGENAIIIKESHDEWKGFFHEFYQSININTHEFSFDEHDRTVAYSLSMPFISTMVFTACLKRQKAPGTTFKRHIEIAKRLLSEDDHLLTEILFNPYTLRHVGEISGRLSYLSHIIKESDHDEMRKFLARLRENLGHEG